MVARHVLLIVFLVLAARGAAVAATAGWADVHVRVYDTSSLRADIVTEALVTAGRVLAPAALELHWTR